MSELNFMEKLLDGVEVEWKALGEVGAFLRGKRFVKTDMISEGTPCIHYGQMYTHYGIWADEAKSFVSPVLVESKKLRTATLPKMSPLNPQYKTKKQSVFQKIAAFVEKFKGVGGQV